MKYRCNLIFILLLLGLYIVFLGLNKQSINKKDEYPRLKGGFETSRISSDFPNQRTAYSTGRFDDMGSDTDGDGKFDEVIIIIEINFSSMGDYEIIIDLDPVENGSPFKKSRREVWDEGVHNVSIPVFNTSDFQKQQEISLKLTHLKIAFYYILVKYDVFERDETYFTSVYKITEFTPIFFTGNYSEMVFDVDNNGRYDFLVILVEVNVSEAEEYKVEIQLNSSKTGVILNGINRSYLERGIENVYVQFDACLFNQFMNTSSSYNVTSVTIEDKTGSVLLQSEPMYSTQVYSASEFDIHCLKINNNTDFRKWAEIENWRGNGTSINPYIIEELIIPSANPIPIFWIENTDVPFQISNCVLSEGQTAISFHNVSNGIISTNILFNNQVGISFWNVTNIIINSNNITSNEFGIWLANVVDILVRSNTIAKNTCGVSISDNTSSPPYNNAIRNNSICHSLECGMNITSSHLLIEWNDFLNNSVHEAIDNGKNNTFNGNFWSSWKGNGGYEVYGKVTNSYIPRNIDPFPATLPNHFTQPTIYSPTGGEILIDTFLIEWTPLIDHLGHTVIYEIHYSADNGDSWNLLSSGLTSTRFQWDLRNMSDGSSYLLKLIASDSLGFIVIDVLDSPFTIKSPPEYQPIFDLIFGIIILVIVSSLLFLKIQRKM